MAEEVKKIITVEVGKSITSIRDFKKHLDDLRGSLLGLNEESEEYKTIAEQIATDQAKLNDVMSVGKKNTDAAAGSYVDLNNQLKALRQQYKALSETERSSTSGQAILQNITKLDTQLRDIDASMGQYQRNVGNYKQAFEGAFQTILGEVGKINPQLGTLISTVQKLIPAFKSVGTAATTTGASIKSAMASTGIGLLVIALGEIVAHWQEISEWATRVLGIQKDITTETKSAADQAKILADKYKEARDYANEIAVAQGKTPLEIANMEVKSIEDEAQRLRDAEKMIEKYLEKYRDTFLSNRTGALAEINQRGKYFQKDGFISEETREKVKDIYDNMIKDLYGFTNDYAGLIKIREELTTGSASHLQMVLHKFEDWLKKQNKINQELADKAQIDLAESYRKQGLERTKYITGLKKDAKDSELALKSQIERENELYEEQRQFIIENIENQALQNEALENLERAHQAKLEQIRKNSTSGSSAASEQKKRDQERIEEIKKSLQDELEALDDKYVEELTLMNKYGEDTTLLTKKWCEAREKIVLNQYEKDLENQKRQQEKLLEAQREALSKDLYQQGKGQDWRILAAQNQNTSGKDYKLDIFHLFPGQERPDIQKEREQIDLIYQIEQQGYMDRIDLYQNYLANLEEGSQEYLETERAIHNEKMDLAELEYEHDQELNKRVIQDAQNRRQIITTLASNTASIWSSFTEAMLANEEQGSNRWKAFKTSEAVVNMLSGVLAAFMSGFNSGIPAPWNIALAASTAAVAAASGAAQIAQINATKMGSTSSANNAITGGASSVGVSPLLNPDYDLQRITNLSLQSDAFLPGNTQVYVLESDIQEVGNRVQVRENNATF